MAKHPSGDPLHEYLSEIQRNISSGIAREQTHRHALEDLLESLDSTIEALNDPKHIEVGAPDFTIRRKGHATDFPVGWIETKDVGEDLDKTEKSDQIKRYFGLHNLILTDYLEFRWYVDGKLRLDARLASLSGGKRLRREPEGERQLLVLLHEFLAYSLATLYTPQDLAERMAKLAHIIRDLLLRALQTEPASGHLHNQFDAFRETLIPDLKPDQFSDMYAQTIAYGLFAARCQTLAGSRDFSRAAAADLIPRTNPFLRRLFREIAFELDPRVQPFVDDLVALLRYAEIGKIMEDFGKRTAREDPVVHFYEDFLQEYDPKVREMRGVYYTPEPVVSYIVRSVDHLLKTKFNKPLGLADKDVLILDPACGTGTFLYFVIRHIYDALVVGGQKGQWNSYVSENLLKRLFGFELLMAPYAVAHLKLGLLLQELGYKFESDERLAVYLTNTLEEAIKRSEAIFAQWIADEANTAAEIKKDKPIMVVLGNPPYSGISANRGEWITKLIEDYRKVDGKPLGEKKVWLADDYVKFIRFAQWRIDRTSYGILGFITNHGYLDNPTFRGMRRSLMSSFNAIYCYDLHGSSKKKEKPPQIAIDKNVFDIQQGVAIGVFIKEPKDDAEPSIHHSQLWGSRENKYKSLYETDIASTKWQTLPLSQPYYFFVPRKESHLHEYELGWALPQVFPLNNSGIITARDEFVLDFDKEKLRKRIETFLDKQLEDRTVQQQFNLTENYAWRVSNARKELMADRDWRSRFGQILYRPFNFRQIYFHPSVVWRPRLDVMSQMQLPNVALIATRQTRDQFDVLVTNTIVGHKSVAAYDINTVFPLYVYGENEKPQKQLTFSGQPNRHTNLSPAFTAALTERLGLTWSDHARGDLKNSIGPEDAFDYIYAVLNCGSYRDRYAELLRTDFPRVPLTSDHHIFAALAKKGAELISLHLLESPKLDAFITRYEQPGDHLVERVSYAEPNAKVGIKSGRVYISRWQFFEGVPKEVWEFHIGGYQVCEKWLKDRKDRKLSSDDIDHYQKIIVALSETIRIMKEIDDLIPGWPLP